MGKALELSNSEATNGGRCSIKKLRLKISQYSLENTCVKVSFLIKLQAFRIDSFSKTKQKTFRYSQILNYFQKYESQ